jgi:hypothetical protein
VVSLRKEVEALNRESPQIATLRDEVKVLLDEYLALQAQEGRSRPAVTSDAMLPPVPTPSSGPRGEPSERLRDARSQSHSMVERLTEAQLSLDTARAAFKYRYSVVWPAQLPTDPVSPNPLKVFFGGGILSLLLAFAVVSIAEVRRGRIEERWQVERTLGLQVLGEFGRR